MKKFLPMGNSAFAIDEKRSAVSTGLEKSAQDSLAEQILSMSTDLQRKIDNFTQHYDGNDRDSIRSLGKVKEANRILLRAKQTLGDWINSGWPGSW